MAYTTTSDAVNTKIDYTVGKPGSIVKGAGCGKDGVVVVNEFVDYQFIIHSHDNEFTFHSYFDHSTSSMTGSITIVDKVAGLFQDFLRTEVAKKLNVSQTHIIFALKTYIIGTKKDHSEQIIPIKPLIFHMYNLTQSFNKEYPLNYYTLMYVADYNTFALLPNYSNTFQMTITHKNSSSPSDFSASNLNIPPSTPNIVPTNTPRLTPTVTITNTVPISPTPTITGGTNPCTLTISENGRSIIKNFEGLSLTAYFDVNAWAIGYGHRRGVNEGDIIDNSQAEQFLTEDLQWVNAYVCNNVKVPLNQNQYDALCSLTYNVGSYPTLLSNLNAGDYNQAKNDFALYCNSGGKVNQALVNRRAQEAALFDGQPLPTGNQPLPLQPSAGLATTRTINTDARYRGLTSNRNTRISNNKTMLTLKDIMEGFESALKDTTTPPEPRLSSWMASINQNYVNPLIPDDQKKSKGVLPIDYYIRLDDVYNDYVIDNRNIPFEQNDQSQLIGGIKSFQVKPGKMITKTINNLMKLSNQVGEDARDDIDNQKSYKCNISTIKTCDEKYQFDIHITRYVVPKNNGTIDTGPGIGEGAYKPLEFSYQETSKTRDILDVGMSLFSNNSLGILSQPNNSQDNRALYGNREQIMLERNPEQEFFKTSYSGVRGMANPKNYGLERPNGPVYIDNLIKTNLAQTTKLMITIMGNPYLLSDLFRNPIKVMSEDDDNPYYYKYPEYYPMYAKLNIFIKPSTTIGEKLDKNTPKKYYYSGYYHLGKVKTSITSSFFNQILELYRTDDVT